MSTRYRIYDHYYPHFITFAVVEWADALSRPSYKQVIVDSLIYYCFHHVFRCGAT